MEIKRIFEDLDKHASEFNFPVLDNAYVEFAGARLTGFRSAKHWLVCLEILGFSIREAVFVDDVYSYGSCIEKGGYYMEQNPVTPAENRPLFDSVTNECIADWSGWSVNVGERLISFSPTQEDYRKADIFINRPSGPGSLKEIELLRFLVHQLGTEALFMSEEALRNLFPNCGDLSALVQTTHWQHPDIAGGEKPSNNVSIRSLINALAYEDPAMFEPGRPNTHWQSWDERHDGAGNHVDK
jgi:hypothetical protein